MKLGLIALFGVFGVLARYGAGLWIAEFFPVPFPYATFAVNVLGCFLVGIVYVLGFDRAAISPEIRTAIMVGFLGGFTTFSSYGLEVARLIEEAEYAYAAVYAGLSPVLGIAGVFAGLFLARKMTGDWIH